MGIVGCNLKGGLGNYMFQIAATVAYGLEHHKDPTFNLNSAQQIHRHTSEYKTNLFRSLNEGCFKADAVYYEPSFSYNKIPPSEGNLWLEGYFQSELYFIGREESIGQIFSETPDIKSYIDNKYENLLEEGVTSVHVRRANYLDNPNHPAQSMDYYSACMEELGGKFLVFSDDPAWCKENFKDYNATFIEGEEDFIDLHLMARCTNNIIANSSFSWWGAWLNKNKSKKVTAPARWFEGHASRNDTSTLLPEEWICM